MNATKILWGQVLLVSFVVLAFLWEATEWVACRLAFQSQLGRPWFEVFGWPVYQPPAFFWWWFVYDAYARDIFIEELTRPKSSRSVFCSGVAVRSSFCFWPSACFRVFAMTFEGL